MTSTTLESLPNEVLYRIIIFVEYSLENLQALTLTCRRIRSVLVARAGHGKILEDIGMIQYPHAFQVLHYPNVLFSDHASILSFSQLDRLKKSTRLVDGEVDLIREIRQDLLEQKPQLVKYLATKGWDHNLRSALHLAMFPSLFSGFPPTKVFSYSEFATFMQSVPAHYVLAYRHASFMIAEASTLVDPISIQRAICEGFCYVRHRSIISEINMRKESEQYLSGVIARCHEHWTRQKGHHPTPKLPSSGTCYGYQDGGFDRLQVGKMINKFLDERIQSILSSWDRYTVEDPVMMDNLQQLGCSSPGTSAVRDLVESFAGLDSAISPQPADSVIDPQLWAHDPPSIHF